MTIRFSKFVKFVGVGVVFSPPVGGLGSRTADGREHREGRALVAKALPGLLAGTGGFVES